MHLLLEFRDGRTEEEVIDRAREAGVRVYPLSEYRTGGERRGEGRCTAVILGYATLSEEEIAEAAKRLVSVWS